VDNIQTPLEESEPKAMIPGPLASAGANAEGERPREPGGAYNFSLPLFSTFLFLLRVPYPAHNF